MILLACFFLSGAAALIYEVVWARKLTLIFGSSTVATSLTLAAYLGGLALGAYLGGRALRRIRRPVMLYGLLELLIGVYAVASLYLFDGVGTLYTLLHEQLPTLGPAIQFALVFTTLVLPTAAMGATLPLLVAALPGSMRTFGSRLGRLYATNTLGAVLGALAAGLWLLPSLGLLRTTGVAALINIILGMMVVLLARRLDVAAAAPQEPAAAAPPPEPTHDRDTTTEISPPVAAAFALLSGCAALAFQVIWTRSLDLVIGNSTRAFSLMVATFLAGLSIGIALGTMAARRLGRAVLALAVVQILVGTAFFASGWVVQELPALFLRVFAWAGGDRMTFTLGQAALCAITMLPATVALGAVFPILVQSQRRTAPDEGETVGRLYAANTIGCILGSLGFGILVVARLGLGTSYAIAALISFAAAALLLAQRARTRAWLAIPAAAGIAAWAIGTPWNPLLMTAGVYFYAPWVGGTAGGLLEAQRSSRLLFYRDGLSGAVTVKERGDDRYLSVDGRGEGGTSAGSQFLLGHLPFMLGRDIRSIYVIGLGTGTTVGATTLYGPQTIEVAELEPAIVDATRYFADVNLSPLDDPRVALRLTDGRNHLLLSRPACYDAIVSQPSNPWIPGASKLFTDEFYALARSRLRSGGVLVQWVQVYNIDNQSLRALLRTFARAFPYILGFDAAEGTGELLLVGSDQPVRLDLAAVRDALADPVRRAHLARVSAGEVGSIVGRIVFGQRERAELAAQGVLNTDDNGLIEFATERSLYDPDSLALNLQYLRGFVRDPLDDLASIPAGQELHDLLASMARYSLRQDDRSRADQLALRALAHGDSATASLIAGDHWHARQRFSEAVAAWRRVIALDPANREAAQRLVRHFRGLPQAQRPAEYDGWTAIAGGTAPATATGETRPGPQQ